MPENEPTSAYDLSPASPISPPAPLWRPSPLTDAPKAPPTTPPSKPGLTALFMILGGGLVIGTILQQQKPDYCPNDAARWNTVYYLVEHGTYEYLPDHGAWWNAKKAKSVEDFQVGLPFWTIDMVAFKDAEGQYHFHSSKPPLLSTIVAGAALAVEKVTGAADAVLRDSTGALPPSVQAVAPRLKTLRADYRLNPWFIMRTCLILVQAIPYLFFVWVMGRILREMTALPQALVFCLAAAALGTYLTPWTITLNNHVLAGFAALFAAYATIRVWYDDRREWYWFALAGFFAALAATMEMPAAALTASVLVALLWKDWRRTLLIAVPLALIPAAAFFGTNYLEVGSFRPVQMRFDEATGPYHYPGSYWNNPNGMDALKEPNHIYLMHMLIGHHGMFLLMPVLLLGLLGAGRHLQRAGLGPALLVSLLLLAAVGAVLAGVPRTGPLAEGLSGRCALLAPLALMLLVNAGMYLPEVARPRPMFALVVLLITAVVATFYTLSSQHNYGGGTQGFRWMFWILPLWLLMLPAGAEWALRRRIGPLVCYSLLLFSMITVGYAFRTPWSDSWAHVLFRQMGWINY